MTEKTKKPRRKRRTKAEIEAEKARLEARQEAAVVKEEKPTAVTSKEAVKEEPAASVEPTVSEEPKLSAYQQAKRDARKAGSPVTYANPNGEYIQNRHKRNRAERRNQS